VENPDYNVSNSEIWRFVEVSDILYINSTEKRRRLAEPGDASRRGRQSSPSSAIARTSTSIHHSNMLHSGKDLAVRIADALDAETQAAVGSSRDHPSFLNANRDGFCDDDDISESFIQEGGANINLKKRKRDDDSRQVSAPIVKCIV
jgi:hypothetical protein